jgi:hypothetical protein
MHVSFAVLPLALFKMKTSNNNNFKVVQIFLFWSPLTFKQEILLLFLSFLVLLTKFLLPKAKIAHNTKWRILHSEYWMLIIFKFVQMYLKMIKVFQVTDKGCFVDLMSIWRRYLSVILKTSNACLMDCLNRTLLNMLKKSTVGSRF